MQIARESSDWDVGVYESSPTRVSQIAELLERDWPKNAKHILNLSFPHLLTFEGRERLREFLPIYQGLLEVLVLGDSSFSSEDWNTSESLVSAVLEAGLDDSQYSDLLEHLYALWDEHGSIVKIGWALDTLDLFAVHPCKNA